VRQRQFKTPIKGGAKSKDAEDGRPKQGQPETERYSLQIDRQSKRSFATPEAALAAAKEMKSRFPALQCPFTTLRAGPTQRWTDRNDAKSILGARQSRPRSLGDHFPQGPPPIPMPSNDQAHHLFSTNRIAPDHAIVGRFDQLVEQHLVVPKRCLPKPIDRVLRKSEPLSHDVV
jgi:hypothetical protein